MSIKSCASIAGTHPTYLAGIELGTRNPTWAKICQIADALDVSASQIVDETEEIARVSRRDQSEQETPSK